MKKKSVYNKGYFKPSEEREEKVFGKDLDFSAMAENKIMSLDSTKVDYSNLAYLSNFKTVEILDESNNQRTVLMLILYDQNGDWFTCYQEFDPYFYIRCKKGFEYDVLSELEIRFQNEFTGIKVVDKMDLDELNHLSGVQRQFVKLSFRTFQKMNTVKKLIQQKLKENQRKFMPRNFSEDYYLENKFEAIEEIFEHDLPYSTRVCIDLNIRVSFWYDIVVRKNFVVKMTLLENLVEKPDFTVLAFDIETTKEPLKFPDADIDQVILISYVIDEETFLIVNREICSQDVESFDFNPTKGISTKVTIFNELDEKMSLLKFFSHIKIAKPLIFTSFNGDYFDFPFIEKRCEKHGLSMENEIGIYKATGDKYLGKYFFIHLDCFYWVKRDAFLPHGSQGLKAVTKSKLGYSPIEVDPEEMVSMAHNDPQKLCEYSVSDAVATYYLYKKNIHDFIFALCTIIPMTPDDVLRRGSGTLCENLLMAQAFSNNIIFPNKKTGKEEKFFKGFLIENETYVGGYVECLNNGIYRADIETQFTLNPIAYEELIENVQKVIEFFVTVEKGENMSEVTNMMEVKVEIQNKLQKILDKIHNAADFKIVEKPLIYHIDVASMYPNIILTNRLQPTAIVNNKICSNCIFNEAKNNCKRNLGWDWKVTHYPFTKQEYEQIKASTPALELKASLKTHAQKNYKVQHKNVVEYKEDIVCMRENPFYVDTIRDFRDRRYKYKALSSFHFKELRKGVEENIDHNVRGIYYDSLQLAHKIILNSFYGYVMKKGARWYSMEMAAMVTNVGAKIIQESKQMMDSLGKPLELDTDGIWTLLPNFFPENFELKTTKGGSLRLSYPCSLMNHLIYDKFKNNQYQQLKDSETKEYETRQEMSIFFEIDGPYKAMIIPAAKEEGKKLKKRYCVFNFENKITEIKGFEIKRRGELEIVKQFQREIFDQFLKGNDMKSLYSACSQTARKWLNIITEKGRNIDNRKILNLFGTLKVMARSIGDYSSQKSVAITAAKRLMEIIGNQMMDTAGLNCNFIISKKPDGAQLSQRAIPTLVFQLEQSKQNFFLKKWLSVTNESELSLKSILDWDYYYERFVTIVQKIILIPAILQGVENPMPDIQCPDWLEKKVFDQNDPKKQINITSMFRKVPKTIEDIESQERIQTQLKQKTKNTQMELEIEEEVERIEEQNRQIEEIKVELKNLRLTVLKREWISERQKKNVQSLEQIQMQTTDLKFFTEQLEQRIKKVNWNILKICPISDGQLKFWILVDNRVMISKNVKVLRRIYVNSYKEIENDDKIIQKKLPREKQSFHLYEFDIEDQDFRETMNQMNLYLTDPSIEGVYETQVEVDFRAIVQVGNFCKLKQKHQKESNLRLEHLEKNVNLRTPELFNPESNRSNLKVIYVWSIQIRKKQLAMIFFEDSLIVLKHSKKEIENKVQQSQFKNYIKDQVSRNLSSHLFLNVDFINIKFEVVDEEKDFPTQVIKHAIESKGNQENSPIMLVLHSNSNSFASEKLHNQGKLPLLFWSFELTKEQEKDFTSLDWYLRSIEYGCQFMKNFQEALMKYHELSMFVQIPISNLKPTLESSIISSIDLLFARELNSKFCIWWFSKNNYPDLGTRQKAEIEGDTIFTAKETKCEISRPFLADHYVFEIEIYFFHFNSLVYNEIEHQAHNNYLNKKRQSKGQNLHRDNFSISNQMGFAIIKELFIQWYNELKQNNNEIADVLLRNLVRWMCDENSYFYDPYLKQTFYQKTKIMFDDFIKDLEGLGANVIYASHNKIIISTNKIQYFSANNFVDFILNSLVDMQKYQYLSLKIVHVYKQLIFYDIHNFAGIKIDNLPQKQEILDEEIEQYIIYHQNWKLKHIFPVPVQKYFEMIIRLIVEKYYEIQKISQKINDYNYKRQKEIFATQIEQFLNGDFIQEMSQFLNYCKEQFRLFHYKVYKQQEKEDQEQSSLRYGLKSQHLNNQADQEFEQDQDYEEDSFLVEDGEEEDGGVIVKEAKAQQNIYIQEESDEIDLEEERNQQKDWSFPQICGVKYKPKNLPLEIIKIVFEILIQQNHPAYDLLIKVKKELLEITGVNYFSEESKFQKVFQNFQVYDVICKRCYLVMNIDVFLDLDDDCQYKCQCQEPYEKFQIENKIIQLLKDCQERENQPKMYCENCKSIKEDFYFQRCYCGGQFKAEMNATFSEYEEEKKNGFENFKLLAVQCRFEYLQDILLSLEEMLIELKKRKNKNSENFLRFMKIDRFTKPACIVWRNLLQNIYI